MHQIPDQYRGARITPKIKEWLKTGKPPFLTLTGPTGTGKTRQLYAILDKLADHRDFQIVNNDWCDLLDNHGSGFVLYTVAQLVFEFTALSYDRQDPKASRAFLDQLMGYRGILMLDDLSADKPNNYAVNLLYMVINDREKWGLRTIVTTNLDIPGVQQFWGARIADRLAGGLVLPFTGKSRRWQ